MESALARRERQRGGFGRVVAYSEANNVSRQRRKSDVLDRSLPVSIQRFILRRKLNFSGAQEPGCHSRRWNFMQEPDYQGYLPPHVFAKCLPIRKMVGRGGGDRKQHRQV